MEIFKNGLEYAFSLKVKHVESSSPSQAAAVCCVARNILGCTIQAPAVQPGRSRKPTCNVTSVLQGFSIIL